MNSPGEAVAPLTLPGRLRGTANYLAAIAMVLAFAPVAILSGVLQRRDSWGAWCKYSFSRLLLRICGVRAVVDGLEHVPATGGLVLISNHESFLDPPLLAAVMPRPFSAVAKRELFNIPVLGQGFRGLGFLSVERTNPRQAMKSLDSVIEFVAGGGVMLVFPEGHRTRTGELLDFEAGAFILAIKAGVPIVPAGIAGTRQAMPAGQSLPCPGQVQVTFGAPIPTDGLTIRDRRDLSAHCRQRVAELRDAARAQLAKTPRK